MGFLKKMLLIKGAGVLGLLLAVSLSTTRAEDEKDVTETEETEIEGARGSKLLPIFQVVRFPNDICSGTSRNGTCYTAEECSNKGGTNDGTCASGFGVCCIFALACGGTASENSTYIVQASSTAVTSPCTYTVCKCSTDICRLRYDFTTFVLANAVQGTAVIAGTAGITASSQNGASLGDCMTDQFSITSPGSAGTPVICGTNGGYHMIIDASDACHTLNFNIGGVTTTTRKWDIKVTQYACGDYDSSGWPGCLQYYTATAAKIQNFGWPSTATTVTTAATHLSNQNYDICIRRGSGYCYICYSPTYSTGTTAASQQSFGVSIGGIAAKPSAQLDTDCTTDYLDIPYSNTATIAAITSPGVETSFIHRLCGRYFSTITDDENSLTVCTRRSPFIVGVNFDSNELTGTSMADAKSTDAESSEVPAGHVGFKLTYFQVAC